MSVPPGFQVELVAAEPDLVNPVAMTFDERGRIFVTESVEYPRREPGPGRDRVKVLEDTDFDGRADRFTVFADGLNIPSGLAVGYGGVWVANAPDLLLLRDTDGDGRADEREVVVRYELSDRGPAAIRVPASGIDLTVLWMDTEPADLRETFDGGLRWLHLDADELVIRCRYRAYERPSPDAGQREQSLGRLVRRARSVEREATVVDRGGDGRQRRRACSGDADHAGGRGAKRGRRREEPGERGIARVDRLAVEQQRGVAFGQRCHALGPVADAKRVVRDERAHLGVRKPHHCRQCTFFLPCKSRDRKQQQSARSIAGRRGRSRW